MIYNIFMIYLLYPGSLSSTQNVGVVPGDPLWAREEEASAARPVKYTYKHIYSIFIYSYHIFYFWLCMHVCWFSSFTFFKSTIFEVTRRVRDWGVTLCYETNLSGYCCLKIGLYIPIYNIFYLSSSRIQPSSQW